MPIFICFLSLVLGSGSYVILSKIQVRCEIAAIIPGRWYAALDYNGCGPRRPGQWQRAHKKQVNQTLNRLRILWECTCTAALADTEKGVIQFTSIAIRL